MVTSDRRRAYRRVPRYERSDERPAASVVSSDTRRAQRRVLRYERSDERHAASVVTSTFPSSDAMSEPPSEVAIAQPNDATSQPPKRPDSSKRTSAVK